jgi:uncharacterized protein YndB with AHSA1/START domain
VKALLLLTACLGLVGLVHAGDDAPAGKKPLDPVLVKLGELVGGVWVNDNPKFVVENRFEWAFNHSVIRGRAVLDKGGPGEQQGEAYFGWDPVAKSVYYLDCHGGQSIYMGTVSMEGAEFVLEFAGISGSKAKYREKLAFPAKDEMKFTVFADKDGKWTPAVNIVMHRKQPADPHRQVSEALIDAPRDLVWKAFTTKEGQESWNVAHAEIDLRPGGKMLTQYDAAGKISDPDTIENIINALDPGFMFTITVGTPPEKFPYKNAIKKVWHVIYFEEVGPKQTRVRCVGNGYGDDEEAQKLRAFFEKGNAYTLQKLQEKFAGKAGAGAAKPK